MSALEKLAKLEEAIAFGNWVPEKSELFEGADIAVCFPSEKEPSESITYITTENPQLISSLIFEMKDICSDDLDHVTKYEFFGCIANAANEAIVQGKSESEILISMIEAVRIKLYQDACSLYFAYGSNMNVVRMTERCPNAFTIGMGYLEAYRFKLDCKGVATVVKEEGCKVYGILWRITDVDEANLDIYEGVQSGCYKKEHSRVYTPWGVVEALVYISLRDTSCEGWRSGYLELIIEAVRYADFPSEYKYYLESYRDKEKFI